MQNSWQHIQQRRRVLRARKLIPLPSTCKKGKLRNYYAKSRFQSPLASARRQARKEKLLSSSGAPTQNGVPDDFSTFAALASQACNQNPEQTLSAVLAKVIKHWVKHPT